MEIEELKEYMIDLEDVYNPTITNVEFEKMLFNRQVSDAVYFFGFGNFNEKSIYFNNIDILINELNLKVEFYPEEKFERYVNSEFYKTLAVLMVLLLKFERYVNSEFYKTEWCRLVVRLSLRDM